MAATQVVLSGRPLTGQKAAVRPSRRPTRVFAQLQCTRQQHVDARTIAAGLAAAAVLLTGSAANAGVILQQPEVKKVFQASAPPPKTEAAAPSAPAPKAAPKAKESAGEGSAFDVRTLVLPVSVLGIAGAGFALTKIDPEFNTILDKGSLKDNNLQGVGYEPALKAGGEWPKYELSIKNGKKPSKVGTVKVGTGLFGKKK